MAVTIKKATYAFEYWDDNNDGKINKTLVSDVLQTAGFPSDERGKINKHLRGIPGLRITYDQYASAIKKYLKAEYIEEKKLTGTATKEEETYCTEDDLEKEVMEVYEPVLKQELQKTKGDMGIPDKEVPKDYKPADYVPKWAKEVIKDAGSTSNKPKPYDAETPAKELREAMKGAGTNEKKIIHVFTKLTHDQRKKVTLAYKKLFNRDLVKDLKDETGWDFETALIYLATPYVEMKAMHLKNAMKGVGTRERDLIDVLAFVKPGEELKKIKKAYAENYGKSGSKIDYDKLLCDVVGDTGFDFRKALVAILKVGARSNKPADKKKATEDAIGLYKKGEGVWGTDESYFTRMITRRSRAHLQEVSKVYKEKYGKTLIDAIKSETSGDYKNALVALCQTDKEYFVERIRKSMEGLGTDEEGLIYAIVSHEPKERKELAELYKAKYKCSMVKDIKGDTSGHFEKLLVALVEG